MGFVKYELHVIYTGRNIQQVARELVPISRKGQKHNMGS